MKKMPISDRAKQFSPFSALRGLEEALQKKEEALSLVTKPDLSPEKEAEINQILEELHKGDTAKIKFFNNGVIDVVIGKISFISNEEIEIEDLTIKMSDVLDVR